MGKTKQEKKVGKLLRNLAAEHARQVDEQLAAHAAHAAAVSDHLSAMTQQADVALHDFTDHLDAARARVDELLTRVEERSSERDRAERAGASDLESMLSEHQRVLEEARVTVTNATERISADATEARNWARTVISDAVSQATDAASDAVVDLMARLDAQRVAFGEELDRARQALGDATVALPVDLEEVSLPPVGDEERDEPERTDEPADDPTLESVCEPVDESAYEPVHEPVHEPVREPVHDPVRAEPVFDPVARPIPEADDDAFALLAAGLSADRGGFAFDDDDGTAVHDGKHAAAALSWSDPSGPATPSPVSTPEYPVPDHARPVGTLVSKPDAETGASRAFVRPMNVGVSLGSLNASIATLARSAADEVVRLEVVYTDSASTARSCLRLTVWDASGWWEYHDIVAQPDCIEPRSESVAIGDVKATLGSLSDLAADAEVLVRFDYEITIANMLVMRSGTEDTQLPRHHKAIEPIDLSTAGRADLKLETRLGTFVVASRLISLLRSRRSESIELVTVHGRPCLYARIAPPATGTVAAIVAPLMTSSRITEALIPERRGARGIEISQLVDALSANTSPAELERLVREGAGYVRRLAAAHPALPSATIAELLRDGTEAMRSSAATNPSLDRDMIDIATIDPAATVRSAVAGNRAISDARLAQLSGDRSREVRARVAENPVAGAWILSKLAADPDEVVRAAVAANANAALETLLTLTHDADTRVCAAVATNPMCPEAVLQELVSVVPAAVMASVRAPVAILSAGSRIDDPHLRAVVAANPATPPRCLERLARDRNLEVLRAIAGNVSSPSAVRRRLRRKLGSDPGRAEA